VTTARLRAGCSFDTGAPRALPQSARSIAGRGDLGGFWRGVEAMDNSYPLRDLTDYGPRRCEDSPSGWPLHSSTHENLLSPCSAG